MSIETTQPPPAAAPGPSLPISAQALASRLLGSSLVTSLPPPAPALPPPVPAMAPLSQPPGLHVSQTLSIVSPTTAQETPTCICQSQGVDRPVQQSPVQPSPVQQGRRLLSDSNNRGSSGSGSSRQNRRRHSSTGRQLLRS